MRGKVMSEALRPTFYALNSKRRAFAEGNTSYFYVVRTQIFHPRTTVNRAAFCRSYGGVNLKPRKCAAPVSPFT